MVRLYDVTSGSIMLNGMDVRCVLNSDALGVRFQQLAIPVSAQLTYVGTIASRVKHVASE